MIYDNDSCVKKPPCHWSILNYVLYLVLFSPNTQLKSMFLQLHENKIQDNFDISASKRFLISLYLESFFEG